MWTSRQQNEVLNIVQAKKYPEVPTFWRLFCRPKMAEIFITFQRHVWQYICKACWRPQSVGCFRERFMSKQSLCIFNWKWFFFNRNLTIIIAFEVRERNPYFVLGGLCIIGCSVQLIREVFSRLHLRRRRHTFASLWGPCLRFASLWRANSLSDSCVLGVQLSNVCWGLLFCLRKSFMS